MLFENFEAYDVQAERKKARELGMAEGLATGRAESILDLLEDLGPVSSEIREQILSEKDLDTLKVWNKGAARAESVDEFVERFLKGR